MVEGCDELKMVVNQFNYLDLPNLFFNEIIGNVWVGFFFGAIVITMLGSKRNIGGNALIGLNVLWAFSVVAYNYNEMILIVVGLVVALLYYGVISKYLTR